MLSLQAIEAVQKVLDLTKNKKYDAGLLERMIIEIERRVLASRCHSPVASDQDDCTNHIHSDYDVNCVADLASSEVDSARKLETDHLLEVLGKILKQVYFLFLCLLFYGFYQTNLCLYFVYALALLSVLHFLLSFKYKNLYITPFDNLVYHAK